MKIEIKGSGNKYYNVDLDNITCNCSDFLHRRCKFDKTDDRRLCKHLREALELSSSISIQTTSAVNIRSFDRDYVSSIINLIMNVLESSGNILLSQVCGEYRRNEKFISNTIPIIFVVFKDNLISQMFDILKSMSDWTKTYETNNILNMRNKFGLELSIKIVQGEEFSYSVLYNTGPKEFLIKLESTLKRKYNQYMSESGITDITGSRVYPELFSENEIFNYVGLDYIEPSRR